MSDLENARAQSEAKKSVPTMSSAVRARLWAGMNRYLAAEAEHARTTSVDDDESSESPVTRESQKDA